MAELGQIPVTRSRSKTLTFRVTDDEFEQLQTASLSSGARCLSDFIRLAALAGFKQEPRVMQKITNMEKRVDELETQMRTLIINGR